MKILALTAILAVTVLSGTLHAEETLVKQDAPVAAKAALTTTTTLERTLTTTYTVKKRRVGLVGSRPFPTRSETVDGGVVVEKYVNDEKVDAQIVKPDPIEQIKAQQVNKTGVHSYYTNELGERLYKADPLDLKIRNNGDFNN
jgi:hypothetical protein